MKKLIIILLLITGKCYGQTDSITVKIVNVKHTADGVQYKLKGIDTGIKYFTFCRCDVVYKEGEIVKIKNPLK